MLTLKLDEAKRILKIADHMIYITFPAMRENRLLIKILEQVNKAQKSIISFILENEYENKRIRLYVDPKANFKTFTECASKYGITSQHLDTIKQTSNLISMHSSSPMEFVKQDKFVIMSEGMQLESLTHDRIKKYLTHSQEMLKSVESRIKL